MNKAEAVRIFKTMLPVGERMDYWTVQQMWSEFTDWLCKEKLISERQWNTWTTPIRYGSTVAITIDRKWVYMT